MRTPAALRNAALHNLKGHWQTAMLITLVSLAIGVYSLGPLPNVTLSADEWISNPTRLLTDWNRVFYADIRTIRAGLFYLLGAAGVPGHCLCYLRMARQLSCRLHDLFSCFPRMVSAIGLRLLRTVLTFLGLSLFLLPGIFIHYTYALAPWIMAERPDSGALQALRESRRRMKGFRRRMLLLDLSFAGWFLLGILSFGIGLLFFVPYHSAARAEFFRDLLKQQA